MRVKKRNGRLENYDPERINRVAERACQGLDFTSASELVLDSKIQFYDKIKTEEIDSTLTLTARQKIYKHYNWSYVASRILISCLYKDVFGYSVDSDTFGHDYRSSFVKNIKIGVKRGIYRKELLNFDLKELSDHLQLQNDDLFLYQGLKNLYDRYFIRVDGKIIETPQAYFMRIAMGLSIGCSEAEVITLYNIYSNHLASPSTPTLFNSGTVHSQMSSCYLSEIADSVDGIFDGLHQEARKSKYAGGLGFHFSSVRASGAHIKGTNGKSSGVVPWLKVYNDMLIACDQAGKRRGSGCVYLEPWHLDIYEFCDLRKVTGDDRIRTHDLNTALWVPDLFMKRVKENGKWTLFCPSETSDLPNLYGKEFEEAYIAYEDLAEKGEINRFKTIQARDLWQHILKSLWATSHPWITFKDAGNIRYSNSHQGVIHGSNLCCVVGSERVPTDKGILMVRELYDEGTPNLVVGRNGICNASEMQLTIKNAPVVKVITKNGYEHRVTNDHPLWVSDLGWVEAQHLRVGDKVEVQQIEGLWGGESFEDAAFIMGLVAGDGTFLMNRDKESVCIDIWEKDFNLINEIESKVKKIINNQQLKTSSLIEPRFVDCNTGQSSFKKKRLISRPLANLLSEYGFSKKTKLQVPSALWRANKQTVSSYLRGLYITDGTCVSDRVTTTSSIASSNLKFLKDLQIILANLGIKSHINKMRDNVINLLPDGKGGKKHYSCNPCYRLLVTSRQYNRIINDLTGFISYKGYEIPGNCNSDYRTKNLTEIVSVKDDGVEDVYCLKVDHDDRAWVCNGLVTKNTEIFLHTKASKYDGPYGEKTEVGETATCNLASINLAKFVKKDKTIDYDLLHSTIREVIHALDRVIDLNFYPTEEAYNSNMKHRPIGMGTMGWADVYFMLDILQDSDEGVKFADELMERISYYAILASNEAGVFNRYSSFEGSKWSQGKLPIDTYNELMRFRGNESNEEGRLDWASLRKSVSSCMRNSNVMAIAPNASIARQIGVEQSIEPIKSVVYVEENLSGDMIFINRNFVDDMVALGLWDDSMAERIKDCDGELSMIPEIPDKLKRKYCTNLERDMFKLIDANAARQKWIDQGISFNIYCGQSDIKYLNRIYFYAWDKGLKSTYYLRTFSATEIAKVTSKNNEILSDIPEDVQEMLQKEDEGVSEYKKWYEEQKRKAELGSCEMCEG